MEFNNVCSGRKERNAAWFPLKAGVRLVGTAVKHDGTRIGNLGVGNVGVENVGIRRYYCEKDGASVVDPSEKGKIVKVDMD
jgi:hypothetical protein